jgi:monovalent cation/proton antiporter MnhG/PhaG subunit
MAGTIVDVAAAALLFGGLALATIGLLGLLLATIGLYGMLRRPVIFDQIHAAGLVTGPAVILVLLAAIAADSAETLTSAVLVILFVFITSPLSGHAVAQAAWRRRRDEGAPAGEPRKRSDRARSERAPS